MKPLKCSKCLREKILKNTKIFIIPLTKRTVYLPLGEVIELFGADL